MTECLTPTTRPTTVLLGCLVAVMGCASSPGVEPHEMSAAEHRREAAAEEQQAEAHEAHYDPDAVVEHRVRDPEAAVFGRGGTYYEIEQYNPTEDQLAQAETHRSHAEEHRAAAEALEAFEQEECGAFPPKTRRRCPLLGKVVAVEDIDEPAVGAGGPVPDVSVRRRGVRIRFAEGVNIDALVTHARCHLAFAATGGFTGMHSCPLYMRGAHIRSEADSHGTERSTFHLGEGGITAGPRSLRAERGAAPNSLDLLVDDDTQLEELRRRARAHITN